MSAIKLYSGATIGLEAVPIVVEVDATPGIHFLGIVGLPDKAIEESKDRIGAAIRNCGLIAPKQKNKRIIVNLAPADIKKQGPLYDLPIAIGYLMATKQLKPDETKRVFFGELSLDGELRPINSILPFAIMARDHGFDQIIVPHANAAEAALVNNIDVIAATHIKDVIAHLKDTPLSAQPLSTQTPLDQRHEHVDIADIVGQEVAKRALTIAAAGGHNILLSGPPGSGKTMLARALAGILPPLTRDEYIDVAKIYSIAGLTKRKPFNGHRPFRDPHHTTSTTAIMGGGAIPRPGEISLAHRGVLFLDEFAEYPRMVIEALREPMENGYVSVARAHSSVSFPADFMLVAAMNPCPCGNYGSETLPCTCTAVRIDQYQKKISGPILDRIDIQINVPRQHIDVLQTPKNAASAATQSQVHVARDIQRQRFSGQANYTNSTMSRASIKKHCQLDAPAHAFLQAFVRQYHLSARAQTKMLKVARTIADLDGNEHITQKNVTEAATYRIARSP